MSGPGIPIDVPLTSTIDLIIVTDQVHTLMAMPLPVAPPAGQRIENNVLCQSTNTIQEWDEECDNEPKVLTLPQNSTDLNRNTIPPTRP